MYFLLYRCKLRTEHNIKNNNIFPTWNCCKHNLPQNCISKNKPLSSRSVQHMFWYSKDQKPRYPQKSIKYNKKMNSQNHIFKFNEENGISCL